MADGDNTNCNMNFVPRMDNEELLTGFKKIVHHIYSSKAYYERLKGFMQHFKPGVINRGRINKENMMAFVRSVFYLGILDKQRGYYWNLLVWILRRRPDMLPMAVTYSIYGHHFRKVYGIDD